AAETLTNESGNLSTDPAFPSTDAGAPAVMTAGGPIPELGSKMPYIVEEGDTLAKIATKIYGDMNQWLEIQELTSLKNANRVFPGDVVSYQLTETTQAFATAYESRRRRIVIVQAGDTLSTIAQRVYGAAGRWKFIWRQNHNVSNPDRLKPGMEIYYMEADAA